MSLISVNNLTITKTSIIFNIKLEVIELILFESCEFRIILFDEENNIIDVKFYKISGEEYVNWNNDEYIVSWIKNKINS